MEDRVSFILNVPRRDQGRRWWCLVNMVKRMHGRIAILVYKRYKCILNIIVDMRSSICYVIYEVL